MSIEFPNQSEKLELPVIGSSAYVRRNPDATHPAAWMEAGWTVERCEGDTVVVIRPIPEGYFEKPLTLQQFYEYQQAGMSEAGGPAFDSGKYMVVPPSGANFDPTKYEALPPISADRAQAFGGGVAAVVGVEPPARIELITSMPDWSQPPAPIETVKPGLEALEAAERRLISQHDALRSKYDPETQMNLWRVYSQPAGGEAFQALSSQAKADVNEYRSILDQLNQVRDRLVR